MTETVTGLKIICHPNFPIELLNEETNELETFHGIQEGGTLFVSEEVFTALNKKMGDMDE